ncbi:MAG: sulfatase [Bacteroidota bacterium]
MKRYWMSLKSIAWVFIALLLLYASCTSEKRDDRPNILWIITEDMSCHFGYNGEEAVKTPNVDQLAADGMVFTNAYVTGPVCSPSRSALITGMYQTTIGAHNHRSSSTPESAIHLPGHIKLIPHLFREAGYYVSNCKGIEWSKAGKTDYNFVFDTTNIYDGTDWSGRKEGQPFFAQVQLWGGKLTEKQIGFEADTSKMKLPPYYPGNPVIVDDWKRYLGSVMQTDYQVGKVMERLEDESLLENTLVFFISDHGISHIRDKQYLYDGGTKIPFIIRAPGRIEKGRREELIAHIDMAATSLYFAGIEMPGYMEGRSLYGPQANEREYVISARDRCDETEDRIRSVRKGDFKYIRNFHPQRPYLQPNAYKDNKAIMKRMRALHVEGKLNEDQALIMRDTRPGEELYDLSRDPFELHNLADDETCNETLLEMRSILEEWIDETGDQGQYAEEWDHYTSNIEEANAAMLKRNTNPNSLRKEKERNRNAALMKQWREEGK